MDKQEILNEITHIINDLNCRLSQTKKDFENTNDALDLCIKTQSFIVEALDQFCVLKSKIL